MSVGHAWALTCRAETAPTNGQSGKHAAGAACGFGTGETRAIGPQPEVVEIAQMELQEIYQAKEMNEKIFNGKLMELKGRSLVENGGHGRTTVQVRADEKLGEALMRSSSCGTTRTSEKGYGTPLPKSTSPVKPTSKTEPKKKVEKMTTSPSTATPATASSMTPLDIDTVSIESGTSIEEVETVLETVVVTKSRKSKKEKESAAE